ncbi:MAG: hypothetical protein V2I34_01210 [Bacteroidales bacterium]|jgi:hypothetical protein|nr:hypothetical protein [Bacteroidales bacterium]
MNRINKILNLADVTGKMITYNLKIIFANRFIWFLLGAITFYLGLTLIYVFTEDVSEVKDLYGIFVFCGILLVFYPTVFGIQNDQDARTIEILFGIPNYRYKVWLVRIALIYVISFAILLAFSSISSFLVIPLPVFAITYHVLFPVFFLGVMSFMLSTIVKNGNGTAVLMIIFGLFFLILQEPLETSKWNVFLNPFTYPDDISETAWSNIVRDNRIILFISIIVFLLTALFNLQKREKFI